MMGYKVVKQSNLTFYISPTNRLYVKTELQTIVIMHKNGVFYRNSNYIERVVSLVIRGKIKNLNDLSEACRVHQLIWVCINRLPEIDY